MKLNIPMKKLKPGDQHQQEDDLLLEREVLVRDAVSPANRPPPTMLTGLSGSRSSTPTIAWATPHTLTGSVASAWTVSTVMSPICSTV